ncbi:MAG TPA: sugar O-acetyltransferase [Firmicutes bacterium]|nr:sugar O-acetyltransferase [Bacillota bacterium]
MTQKERMKNSMLYDPADTEIMQEQTGCAHYLKEYNSLGQGDETRMTELMHEMFAEVGEGCYIQPPFYANWAGKNVHLGNKVYANFCLTLVDDGNIYIGDMTMIAPNVTITTATHPVLPSLREKGIQYNVDVHIGRNVWIGAGAVILPGVTIGDNSVIGAGAVVTRDIPANVVAFGVPCRVVRPIGERDREFYYKDKKIDL